MAPVQRAINSFDLCLVSPCCSTSSSLPTLSSSSSSLRSLLLRSSQCLLLLASLLLLLSLPCSAIGPTNPYLANSIWPIAQHDNYAQASTDVAGPLFPGTVDSIFNTAVAGALTVLYTPDEKVVWGSSLTSVFKVDRSGPRLLLIDSVEKNAENRQKDTFRGIYSILSKEGVFYISSGNVISAYGDAVHGESTSAIEHLRDYDFTPMAKEGERVLALNLSFDGKIIFCTNRGGIGLITRDLRKVVAFEYATAAKGEQPRVDVTNSVSVDEHGGIYLVTSRYMHRMWWDEKAETLHSLPPVPGTAVGHVSMKRVCEEKWRKCEVWSTSYPVADAPIVGRPTKEGSGTTPSLLKDEASGRLFIMIADGRRKQEVLAIDAFSGQIVATAPVHFNNDASVESYTEQSILVSENKLLVSQNALTAPGQRINEFLEAIHATEIVKSVDAPEFVQHNVFLLPVLLGDSPRGFQQFELKVNGDEDVDLQTTWVRNDLGCPNSIPTMSQKTNVMYCVGKKTTPMSELFMQSMNAGWTVEAFKWDDGETVFRKDVGNNLLYNSLYAATQIGADREIIYGCVGGIVRMRAGSEPGRENFNVGNIVGGVTGMLAHGVVNTGGILLSAANQAVRLVGGSGRDA